MCWIKVDLETDSSQVDYGSTKRSSVVNLHPMADRHNISRLLNG